MRTRLGGSRDGVVEKYVIYLNLVGVMRKFVFFKGERCATNGTYSLLVLNVTNLKVGDIVEVKSAQNETRRARICKIEHVTELVSRRGYAGTTSSRKGHRVYKKVVRTKARKSTDVPPVGKPSHRPGGGR